MSEEIVEIIKHGFDTMENRHPYTRESIALCREDKENQLTAHGVASDVIDNLPAEKRYAGWDGEVYPKYEFARRIVG